MAELTRRHPLETIDLDFAVRSNSLVAMTAEPFVSMVDVRLPAPTVGTELFGAEVPVTPNTWVATDGGRIVWLAPDEWLITSATHSPDELEDRVWEAARPLAGAVVDVSAQRIGIRLSGTHARHVLAKGCSIDLHPRVFPRGRAAQTTVGLAGVILLNMTEPAAEPQSEYLLLVRSSFARYLADWLLDAAQEFSTAESFTTAADPISSQE